MHFTVRRFSGALPRLRSLDTTNLPMKPEGFRSWFAIDLSKDIATRSRSIVRALAITS